MASSPKVARAEVCLSKFDIFALFFYIQYGYSLSFGLWQNDPPLPCELTFHFCHDQRMAVKSFALAED
jgi:hypothetical protein